MARSDGKSLAEGEAHYNRAVALDTALSRKQFFQSFPALTLTFIGNLIISAR